MHFIASALEKETSVIDCLILVQFEHLYWLSIVSEKLLSFLTTT